MLLWIGQLKETDILVASSHPLPPYDNDRRFTVGGRNKKPLPSPHIRFFQCGTWSIPEHTTAIASLTLMVHKNQICCPVTDQVPHAGTTLTSSSFSFQQVSIGLHRPHFQKEFEKVIQTSELNLSLALLPRPPRIVAVRECISSCEDRDQR